MGEGEVRSEKNEGGEFVDVLGEFTEAVMSLTDDQVTVIITAVDIHESSDEGSVLEYLL